LLRAIEEVPRRLMQQRQLARFHLPEIHIAAMTGQPGNAVSGYPSPVGEQFQADQIRIARKRR
jgi:hypothetical protein